MCSNCNRLLALLREHNAERQREEHGERIAARLEANRPWVPSEMDRPTFNRLVRDHGPVEIYDGLHE